MSSPTVPFLALITPVAAPPGGPHPEHPIVPPGGYPHPEHPIVIPPDAIAPGVPTHPIYIPVYPAHPIVIPPGAIDPGPPLKPEHPIYLPPYPEHPIVIPPDSVAPGVPTHPIYLPPYPAHPIVLPDPPTEVPPSDSNWQWGWNAESGWHPVFVPGDKPQPVPPPGENGGRR